MTCSERTDINSDKLVGAKLQLFLGYVRKIKFDHIKLICNSWRDLCMFVYISTL